MDRGYQEYLPGILWVDLQPAHELGRKFGQILGGQLCRSLDFRLDLVGHILLVLFVLVAASQVEDLNVAVFSVTWK